MKESKRKDYKQDEILHQTIQTQQDKMLPNMEIIVARLWSNMALGMNPPQRMNVKEAKRKDYKQDEILHQTIQTQQINGFSNMKIIIARFWSHTALGINPTTKNECMNTDCSGQ